MKNKIFKSSKSVISVLIAFAVVAVSLFVAVPAINIDADAAALTATDTWDGSTSAPTKTEGGYTIIETAEQLAWLALSGGDATKGVNYKVAANQVFNMNGKSGITPASTASQVQSAAVVTDKWSTSVAFQGNLDGNGLIVYNLNGGKGSDFTGWSTALFPRVAGTVSIQKLSVRASYFSAANFSAGIVGTTNGAQGISAILSNCEVANCYMGTTATNGSGVAAAFIGRVGNSQSGISNSYAHGNIISGSKGSYALVGNQGGYASPSNVDFTNIISTDTASGVWQLDSTAGTKPKFTSVYVTYDMNTSNATGVIYKTDINGKALSSFDFDTTWIANAGVPELRAFHKLSTTNNGDTHSEKCTRCGLAGLPANHYYNAPDYDNAVTTCACGAATKGLFDDWDGTKSEPTETDADGNIIIRTAEQLAWVALEGGNKTKDKSYKVIPHARFNLNGMSGVTLSTDAATVKAAGGLKQWRYSTDTRDIKFQGNFDGNGLVVYNLYTQGYQDAGLFPLAEGADMTIKNVKVTASHIVGYHYAGGIVGLFSNNQKKNITITGCETANSYISDNSNTNSLCARTAGGILGGTGNATPKLIENCYVHGNIIAGTNVSGAFVGNTGAYVIGDINIKNSIAIGTQAMPFSTNGTALGSIGGTQGKFTNIYSDKASAGATQVTNWAGKPLKEGLSPTLWLANTTEAPALRMFHRLTGTADGANGHSEKCLDCGIQGIGDAPHEWLKGKCYVCDYVCQHPNVTDGKVIDEGSCTTDKIIAQDCECGAAPNKVIEANGHDLEKTSEGFAGNCGTDGEKPYWTCKKCGGLFLSDDKWGTPVNEDDIIIPASGNHTELKDGNGETVWDMTEGGYHKNVCEICAKPYNSQAHVGQDFIPDPNNPEKGHIGTCTVCLLKTEDGVTPHAFGDDNECDTCGYVCSDHQYQSVEEATVTTPGDCITDEYRDIACKVCGHIKNEMTKAGDGHTFEPVAEDPAKCQEDGKAAHNHCSECGLNYAADTNALTTPLADAKSDEDLKLPSLNQDHVYLDKGAFEKEDKADGVHWRNCSICGKVDVAEHKLVEDKITYEGTCKMCECGYYEFAHYNTSDDGIVSISADVGVFPLEVWTEFFDICDEDEIYAKIEELLLKAKIIEAGSELNDYSYLIYDIKPDEQMAENSTAKITFDLSKLEEDFSENILNIDTANQYIKIIRIDLDNQMVKNDITTNFEENEKGKITTASADVDHFSIYAVIDTQKASNGGSLGEGDEYGDFNNEFDFGGGEYGDSSSISPQTAARAEMATVATIVLAAGMLFVLVLKAKKA